MGSVPDVDVEDQVPQGLIQKTLNLAVAETMTVCCGRRAVLKGGVGKEWRVLQKL